MTVKLCPRCDARFRGDITNCPIDGTALREPEDPLIGRTIAGRYLIEQALGTGGMATVYRARHQIIGRDVAMKFLEPSLLKNERQRKRFVGEARAANHINHEHIIDITDFGETEEGMVYMVMEYLEGRTLAEEIEKGPLSPRRALRIATQVALGLARAHELGVVHRDIKPANIYLIKRKLDSDYVKILDFGVARIEQDMRITGQGMIVGTPEYIAPEQIRSNTTTPSADLYSLGCVLFEMLTGRLPFNGKTTILLVQHLNDPPPVPSTLTAGIPAEVDALVLRLLHKDPAHRFRDAHHLVEELQRLLDHLPPLTRQNLTEPSASSIVPPATGPAPAPSEEDSFQRTVQVYRSLLTEAHPNNTAPAWLPQAITHLENTVGEVRVLREHLRIAAQKATEQEEEHRGPRSRIGRALDELAQDDSKVNRQIDALFAQLERAEARLDECMFTVFEGTRGFPVSLAEGEPVSKPLLVAIHAVVDASRRLGSARDALRALRSELEQKRIERKDLRFQMAQLKEQLGALNDASTLDQQIAHDEVHRLSAQIQAKIEAMAPYGKRIAAYFEQFPALKERLSPVPALVPATPQA